MDLIGGWILCGPPRPHRAEAIKPRAAGSRSLRSRGVMAAVFAVLLLGLLAPAAAAPPPPSCDDVITPLRRDQAHKALGSWVLVGSVTDEKAVLLPQLSNSFMELSLSEDNSSFTYIERNLFGNGSCVWYHIVSDITDDANLTVRLHTMVREQGGVKTTTQGFFGQITLFQSCPSCPEDRLSIDYSGVYDPAAANSTDVRFIMNYRREGQHQDLEALKEVPLITRQQAGCLNMTEITGEYSYDGVSKPCPRKVLTLKPEEETEH